MRLLHVTDSHLGLKVKTWGAPRGYDRAHDCLKALEQALQPALREEVDAVVHSGDVFDRSSPPPESVEGAARLFREVARRVPFVLMPGNHDRHGLGVHLREGPNLTIVDEARLVRLGDVALGMVPFVRDAAIWAHDAASVADADVLVAHQSFDGARVPGFTFRVGRHRETVGAQHLPRGVRHILCGHIHPRQITTVAGAQVVQPGSTERTAFSEEHQTKGYAVWDFERRVGHAFHDLESRPLVRVKRAADLRRVVPGTLVLMDKTAPVDLADGVVERGAWFASRRPRRLPKAPPKQMALF